MLGYFKSCWPEDEVPDDSPAWSYWEVDVDADNVIRVVDSFESGQIARNSVALE